MSLRVPTTISLYDDACRADGRNGGPAVGSIFKGYVDGLNAIACRYRPVLSFWGGSDWGNSFSEASGGYNFNWLNVNPGVTRLVGHFLTCPNNGVPSNPQTVDMVVNITVGTAYSPPVPEDDNHPTKYPRDAVEVASIKFPATATQRPVVLQLASHFTNGPQLRSGLVYEDQNINPGSIQAIPSDYITTGAAITGKAASNSDIRATKGIRDFFRSVHAGHRLAFGWAGQHGVSPNDGDCKLNFAPTAYRYLFSQTIGDGGTAPTATGRGITVPLRYSAAGIRTRVRVYVSVLAAMATGAGGVGSLAVYNLDDSGAMPGAAVPLVNGPSITGTTWAWYGWSTPFNPGADAYFLGNAVRPYDRVVLCGKSTSGTDYLRIGAFSMAAYHSVA